MEMEHKLHEAVSSIKVTRSMSPEIDSREVLEKQTTVPSVEIITPSNQTSPEVELLSKQMHAKSASLHNLGTIQLPGDAKSDNCAIEFESDSAPSKCRPHRMVRKKSGELVRSSLKLGAKGRRPASMPSTPAYTKNVHFDRKLEHIRHFLHSEKPAAVSATTSPTQDYMSNSEFPFTDSSAVDELDLTIELPNFIPEAQQTDNEGAIIKVETVYLSTDRRSLIGRVAVRNLSFQKSVCVRYTLDHWRTTSETGAEYTQDVRKKHRDDPFDRFLFSIKIDDFNGVTDKTMFFCVRYNTAGQDYWDSNGGQNFRVEFHRRPVAARRNSDPPKMAPIRSNSIDDVALNLGDNVALRNVPMTSPNSLIFENIYDDHPSTTFADQDQEKPIKMKSVGRRGAASSDSFSNRYDFGASLSAAIAAANTMLQGSGDEVRLKSKRTQVEHIENATTYNPYFSVKPSQLYADEKEEAGIVSPTFPPGLDSSQCNTPTSSGNVSPVPGVTTNSTEPSGKDQAYQSLLDKYCFVWK